MGDTTRHHNEESYALACKAIAQPALGAFGDIPAAYAILQVNIGEAAGTASDARYLYASPAYSTACRRRPESFPGLSHSELVGDGADWLLDYCYRAIVQGETVNGFEYSPLVRGWINFNVAPSPMDGCCVFAFILDEDTRRRQQANSADARTSLFISEMLSALTGEHGHDTAMNKMLDMMSQVIATDRLCVFECDTETAKVTYELCGESVPSMLGSVIPLPRTALKHWFRLASKDPVALVPDTAILQSFSPALYGWCVQNGIKSLMAAPFFNDGEIVGFLGAYNYHIDETIDLNRLFTAVSSFIGARIDNRRLIESLDWTSKHDDLTNLFNRRGSELAFNQLLEEDPAEYRVLIHMDLDDFKHINDAYGHTAGDEALQSVARALEQVFPQDAILCRNGGDEFLVLLSGDNARNVETFIARFMDADLSYEHEGDRRPMAASMGYACYPDQAQSMKDLYAKADIALYAVKLSGKRGYAKYTPEVEARYRAHLAAAK